MSNLGKKKPVRFEGIPESSVVIGEIEPKQDLLSKATHIILSKLDVARGMPTILYGPDGELQIVNVTLIIPASDGISDSQLSVAKKILELYG